MVLTRSSRRSICTERPTITSLIAVLGQLGARDLELAQQRAVLGDALHAQRDLVDLERLGQVVVRAFLDRGDRVLHGRERGHQDDRRVG